MTRAELQLNQQQTEQAYATLKHIDSDRPGQNRVKLMLLEASSQLKDWQQSLSLLQDLERKGALPVEKPSPRPRYGVIVRASSSPLANGTTASPRQWVTSVGTVTRAVQPGSDIA